MIYSLSMNYPGRSEKVKKSLLLLVLLISISSALFAEGTLTMDYSLFNSVLRTRDAANELKWAAAVSGTAQLAYKSSGNKNVKSEISLGLNYPNPLFAGTGQEYIYPLLSLDKAYIKARFPEFRLTAGKTRLSWGDGFVFNAGDILFDSVSAAVDLTSSEIRTDTAWLAAVNIPLGRFSFFEAIVLPPTDELLEELTHTSAGGRIYTTLDSLKLETGYMYKGGDAAYHQFYAGLQGNIEADWYITGALQLPADGSSVTETLQDSFDITAGLFYLTQFDSVRTLSLRLESLIQPFENWSESSTADAQYGILLYPEISFTPSDTTSISVRSIISPIDGSAQITAGGSWNVFQGFSLLGYLIGQAGDSDDTFSWSNETENWTSLACMIGIIYIY